jgi:hypothetical protein
MERNVFEVTKVRNGCQGWYSQNFLRKFVKIAVTLGLNILRFYRPKVFFKANISKG